MPTAAENKATIGKLYDHRRGFCRASGFADRAADGARPTRHDPVDLMCEVCSRVGEPEKLVVLDCCHTGLLAGGPWLTQAADLAIGWFKTHLSST